MDIKISKWIIQLFFVLKKIYEYDNYIPDENDNHIPDMNDENFKIDKVLCRIEYGILEVCLPINLNIQDKNIIKILEDETIKISKPVGGFRYSKTKEHKIILKEYDFDFLKKVMPVLNAFDTVRLQQDKIKRDEKEGSLIVEMAEDGFYKSAYQQALENEVKKKYPVLALTMKGDNQSKIARKLNKSQQWVSLQFNAELKKAQKEYGIITISNNLKKNKK